VKPRTTIADFPVPDITWGLVLLAAAGLAMDGAITSGWLIGETEEYGRGRKEGHEQ
jgi:hypothetical protein